jgi:hypothetical protein
LAHPGNNWNKFEVLFSNPGKVEVSDSRFFLYLSTFQTALVFTLQIVLGCG